MGSDELAALDRAATQGFLDARGWGDGSTQMGMTNVFNDDAEVCVMECIPEADAKFIAALWNAYRANQLVLIGPDAVEGLRKAMHETLSRLNVMAYLDMPLTTADDLATAALAALGVK